jgi:hypothetical protein
MRIVLIATALAAGGARRGPAARADAPVVPAAHRLHRPAHHVTAAVRGTKMTTGVFTTSGSTGQPVAKGQSSCASHRVGAGACTTACCSAGCIRPRLCAVTSQASTRARAGRRRPARHGWGSETRKRSAELVVDRSAGARRTLWSANGKSTPGLDGSSWRRYDMSPRTRSESHAPCRVGGAFLGASDAWGSCRSGNL